MYVRDAKNRDEAWLLDHIDAMGLDDVAFRSRDYVVAVDEESGERAGFGRLRVHKTDDGDHCELTGIGTLAAWRGQGVGAHVVERLVDEAADDGFDVVYSLTPAPNFLAQFGFEPVAAEDLPERLYERLTEKRATVGSSGEADGDGSTESTDADEPSGDERGPDGGERTVVGMRLPVDAFEMPDRLRDRFKSAAPQRGEESGPEESAEDFGIDPEEATYKYDTGR